MSSFEKINYNLRPNKCIERKMMSEALSRLSFIDHLNLYRYIGLGSPYFADFILFHKSLGIVDLISIEKEESKKSRFEFNIPYSGIKMRYGMTTTVLPNLELDKQKNIVWLDYDDKISDFMFSDIDTFFFNAMPGSFFIVSVNIEEIYNSEKSELSLKEYRMNDLINRCGKNRIPIEQLELNLNTTNSGIVAYEMIQRQIQTSLTNRNGTEGNVLYKQLFNFVYKDNATILTIGGIVYDESQKNQIQKMAFKDLPYIKEGSEPYKIQSPNLTFREIKALDKILPVDLEIEKGIIKNKKFKSIPLIPSDIENYAKVYRYYPNFMEATL